MTHVRSRVPQAAEEEEAAGGDGGVGALERHGRVVDGGRGVIAQCLLCVCGMVGKDGVWMCVSGGIPCYTTTPFPPMSFARKGDKTSARQKAVAAMLARTWTLLQRFSRTL